MITAPDLLGSASHHADSDDRLKDAEALAFLAGQPADVRAVWLERCRLLREVDRLSEGDRWVLGDFLREWRTVDWMSRHPWSPIVKGIYRCWFDSAEDHSDRCVMAFSWSCWLDALAADYGRSLVPATLEQHDAMVADVGGFFRLFPFLSPEHWEAIGAFGALDQAWNNVRDLAEDARAGRCYFPAETIARFDLTRAGIMSGDVRRSRRWADFMTFWLEQHLPSLAEEARPFLSATDLHPSVAALRSSCLLRYGRVERVLRGLEFDYRAFPEAYWAEVRRELAEDALGGGAKEVM
ncbi:squalene/phytoene synthase family protein [Sorangium sp. So ce233]|uniref:squalene/phytoene synthase family protein n=1 Tax=Sorangium sp. So ce233 TaxID=3133290 RepID=UPI003F5D84A9